MTQDKYSIRYSKLLKVWLVVNTETRLSQSSWPTMIVAQNVAARLNRMARINVCGMKAG